MDDSGYPTVWYAHQIAAQSLPLRLVVLSSCESGAARSTTPDGMRSLRYAFRVAGAEEVLHTRWRLDDRVATHAMQAFYTSWVQDRSFDAALRQMQLELLRERATALPVYWAVWGG